MRLKSKVSNHAIFRPTVRRVLLDNGFGQERWVGKRAIRYQKDVYAVECICPPDTDLTYAGSGSNNKLRISAGFLGTFFLFAKK